MKLYRFCHSFLGSKLDAYLPYDLEPIAATVDNSDSTLFIKATTDKYDQLGSPGSFCDRPREPRRLADFWSQVLAAKVWRRPG